MHRSWMVAVALTLGCGPDAELVAEKERLEVRVADLEKTNQRLETEADDLHAQVRKQEEKIALLRKREVYTRLGIGEGDELLANLRTSMGDVRCTLWPHVAPQTVLNFVELAEGAREWTDPRTGRTVRRPLYDETVFHRVIPKFMIQGGDPLGNGNGGPGYKFEDEVTSKIRFNAPGLLAMANSGPNTNGSQFFITDRAMPKHLNGKHTIFGQCENLEVVEAIASVERGRRDRPVQDVVLKRVQIDRVDG